MKTPEEIKKALECCAADEPCGECPYRQEVDMCIGMIARDTRVYIQQLEDHIRDLTKMVPRWISVKDRLPENGALVVALCRYDCVPYRYYLLHERYDLRSNFWHDGSAQYWTQLPELPEDENAHDAD